ncbi:hypothetical protein EI555_001686 [Monodon monoceros]|uniref:Rho-GAP domain-containing protein n=1 Tax=Monodon monoceros TaxID=40151 RepID=A0A4U1ER12_MONMO|nr:hypothetical protein EI555_001686 [Monodon monoceros]
MGLQPLEFSDCYLDSPWFRERIRAHEAELERTNKFIKELIKDGKNLIAATKTDWEKCPVSSLPRFCIKEDENILNRLSQMDKKTHLYSLPQRNYCGPPTFQGITWGWSLSPFRVVPIEGPPPADPVCMEHLLGLDLTATVSSKRAKAKTTKKGPRCTTSSVFATFDQSQIHEFKEAFRTICQNRDGFIDAEGFVCVDECEEPDLGLSAAQRKFAHSLRDFKFEFIGDAETDDERCIDASLREFSNFLKNLEEQREIMALSVTETLIKPLEKFRKEQLGAVKEEKKKFDKETEKNYSLIDKHLNLSAKKKDSHLQEADIQVEQNRQHFYELSLEYVCKLQEIQERKKFEFVEPMLSFFQGMFTFYHQGHELAKDFNHYKMELQINIQNTRNRFEGTRSEVEELMNKIRQNPKDHKRASQFTAEGYLYVQEKRPPPFGSSWVKHYCMYRKAAKKFNIIPFEHRSGGKLGDGEVFFLKECIRRHTDSIDRRFCFDVEAADRPGVSLTMQAFSEEERKQWLEALGGKEALFPSFNRAIIPRPEGSAQLDKMGFTILRKCISAVETRDVKTCNEVDLENSIDWEVKTITSALKQYLRSLPEPLMTYELHGDFIVPAKSGSPESRVNAIHFLVHKLPEKNKEMLDILVKHLTNVSNHSKQNLMTVANLGVVFGPTLMRPQEETVAAIMDLKFQNIVVEILIENHEKLNKFIGCYLKLTIDNNVHCSGEKNDVMGEEDRDGKQVFKCKFILKVISLLLLLGTCERRGDRPNLPKEDTPPSSLDSFSSPSPTAAAAHGPPGPDKNHLLADGGTFGDWASTAVISRKARAVYPCEAEHSSELSFEIGAIFEDGEMIPERWLSVWNSPPLDQLILLLEENGKEAAFLELLHSPDILSGRVSSNDAFTELQTPQRAVPSGRRMEPKPENVLKSHEHPKRETKDETKVQKK